MRTKYLIGIDGGGTKTKLILTDDRKNIIDHTITGPSNITKSIPKAWESIQRGINRLLSDNKIDPLTSHIEAGLGLAGAENQTVKTQFLAKAQQYAPYLQKISLESDAYVACLGVHRGEAGALVIIGTGTQGYQIEKTNNNNNNNNTSCKLACWGSPVDDQGGGSWMGLEAIRLTFKCADGRLPPCLLSELIFQKFDYDIDKFCIWANQANTSDYASLTKELVQAAAQKDKPALKIIKAAAQEIILIIKALEKKQQTQTTLPLCLVGGMAPFVLPYLPPAITNRIIKRDNPHDVCYGALDII